MKFGLMFQLQTPKPLDADQWGAHDELNIYHEALEQIEFADQFGYDYVFITEHHFLEEYCHSLPSSSIPSSKPPCWRPNRRSTLATTWRPCASASRCIAILRPSIRRLFASRKTYSQSYHGPGRYARGGGMRCGLGRRCSALGDQLR